MALKVEQKDGESSRSVVRRFTRALRRSGILGRLKEIRFLEREPSKTKRKKNKLRGMKIQEERERMKKLGKRLR